MDARHERLVYRSQFILGAPLLDTPPSWTRVAIRDGLELAAHPDLGVCRAEDGARTVTLLGFILDSEDPSATDHDIVQRLLAHTLAGARSVIERTAGLGGRWVLIVDDGTDLILFNDAVGFRQVFYTAPQRGAFSWCASQPAAIAEALNLRPDP
jgi:hypothetical protein